MTHLVVVVNNKKKGKFSLKKLWQRNLWNVLFILSCSVYTAVFLEILVLFVILTVVGPNRERRDEAPPQKMPGWSCRFVWIWRINNIAQVLKRMRLTFNSAGIVFYLLVFRPSILLSVTLPLWRTRPAFNGHVGYAIHTREAVSWKPGTCVFSCFFVFVFF